MTEQQITDLGPAFAAYLRRYRPCFLQNCTFRDFALFLLDRSTIGDWRRAA